MTCADERGKIRCAGRRYGMYELTIRPSLHSFGRGGRDRTLHQHRRRRRLGRAQAGIKFTEPFRAVKNVERDGVARRMPFHEVFFHFIAPVTSLRDGQKRHVGKFEPAGICFSPGKRTIEQNSSGRRDIRVTFDHHPIGSSAPCPVTGRGARELHRAQSRGLMKDAKPVRSQTGQKLPGFGVGGIEPISV